MSQISLPPLEKALKDLEEYEKKYKDSTTKLKDLANKIEALKCEKQVLKANIDEYKQSVIYHQNQQIEVSTKIESTLLKQNKATLASTHKLQEIAQIERMLKANKMKFNIAEMDITQLSKLKNRKEELLQQKAVLEKIVASNTIKLKETIKEFY